MSKKHLWLTWMELSSMIFQLDIQSHRYNHMSLLPLVFGSTQISCLDLNTKSDQLKIKRLVEEVGYLIKRDLYNDFYLFSEQDSYLIKEHWN